MAVLLEPTEPDACAHERLSFVIELTRGVRTIVDQSDYLRFSHLTWYAGRGARGNFYARRNHRVNGKRCALLLHRAVTFAPDGVEVDHINGDTLDNRKSNLRTCTHQQNAFNRSRVRDGFKGVYQKTSGRWAARITLGRKDQYLGCFKTEEDAARAYDTAALRLFGGFAYLNFPSTRSSVLSSAPSGERR